MSRKLFSNIIGKFRGEEWQFSNNIPTAYILGIMFRKAIMLLRGSLYFFRFKELIFVGPDTIIRCRSKIRIIKNLQIDRNCYIDALSTNGIIFGRNVSVGKNTTIECTGSLKDIGVGLKIGNNVGLGSHGFFGCAGGVEIGDDCIFGNFVSFHSENHNYSEIDTPIRLQGVNQQGIRIARNCWLGAKVTVLDGVSLGEGSIVAAGAVVKAGIYPPNVIIGGVPAKILKTRTV